ncbi:MAG TPA: hypothetical protein VIB99_01270 [Candidatus Limnocylindrales bacterium]
MRAGLIAGLILTATIVAGCGFGADGAPQPTALSSPEASLSGTLQLCWNQLSSALGAASFNLVQPASAVRPAESPLLTSAPRTVGQVLLPGDPDHGFIEIYEFPDPARAYAAGQQQAAYVASGEGKIQFVPDTNFSLRQYGSCVIFYAWSPSASTDPRSPAIQTVVDSFGVQIPISR